MSDVTPWAQRLADAVSQAVRERTCRPTATYRVQFEAGKFSFCDAAAIAPYLNDLGISHLYASPYLKSRHGSSNCYAIVDYGRLNPELGSDADYQSMVSALHAEGLGQILDTVPNHMSAAPAENPWWTDVLENGPSSPHAAFFDIDWHPVKEELWNRVLLPVLGDQYGEVLETGTLKLEYRDGAFYVRCYEAPLPLDPRTYRTVLTRQIEELKAALPADSEEVRELESIITALDHLPERTQTDAASVAERQREKEVIKGRLRTLVERAPPLAEFIQRNVEELNGKPSDPHSFDALDDLLDAQVYRLSHWKAAADEINYRRFFDINELAAVSMEDPRVFNASHRLLFELLVRGDVDGLRIDHIDGLYDPIEYLRSLQAGYLRAMGKALYETEIAEQGATHPEEPVPAWSEIEPEFLACVTSKTFSDRSQLPLYVVVEKILGADEGLPEQWLLNGTTGYDFLNVVGGLFVESAGLDDLVKIYARYIDERPTFREVAHESKMLILHAAMSSDVQLLAHRLNRISERYRRSRDFTLNTLRVAMREILASFSVYRTYIGPGFVSDRDRQVIYRAVGQAKRRNPTIDAAAFDFIRGVLLQEVPPDMDDAGRRERDLLIGRFQQVTSPVMAKGMEDTTFYRYLPLVSFNEVGGAPDHGPTLLDEFHRTNVDRQTRWPLSLLATTTHDTKRSEDVRARISVLSEIPNLWRTTVHRWTRFNRTRHREVEGNVAPSRNDEYLFYQTLVGAWPLVPPIGHDLHELADRMRAYMEKATHEAKRHTSWINPSAEYDAAVREFVAGALDDHPRNRFLADFRQFHEQVVNWGLYTALSQVLLKLTSPGVPDIYQGQEGWNFSLVDPDNRRSVDYGSLQTLLRELQADVARDEMALLGLARELGNSPRDPRTKLFLTWRALEFRRRHAALAQGQYIPLQAHGERAKHVCAFARRSDSGDTAIVVAPRLLAQLTPADAAAGSPPPLGSAVWGDTRIALADLPMVPLRNVFTGELCSTEQGCVPIAAALADFPVALLTNDPRDRG